ncbi:hypothetical protein [Pediococcus pentosaceus]
MKEVMEYLWNMPAEYILIPVAIIVIPTTIVAGYMVVDLIKEYRDLKKK